MIKEILIPDPERFGETKGRQIDLPSNIERFSHLEKGRDYKLTAKNDKIESKQDLEDFFVFANPSGGDTELPVNPPHWRTISFDNTDTVFNARVKDKNRFYDKSIHYYSVNVKGVGFLKPTAEGINLEDYESWTRKDPDGEHDFGYQMLGLSSKGDFLNIMQKSNFLVEQGLRSEIIWGIAKLKKTYYNGKLVDIDELRKKGVILKRRDYQPHMAVRLLRTNDRIAEASDSNDRRDKIFANAFEIFNKETKDTGLDSQQLDIKNKEHQKIFFKEFFKKMGRNLAVLLNIGYSHFRMHSANITMAAEVVDIGTVSHWSEGKNDPAFSKKYNGVRRDSLKDMRDIAYSLKKLLKAAKLSSLDFGDREDLKESFMQGFDEAFNVKHVEEIQKTNPQMARKWVDAILEKVIVQRERLAPLIDDEENTVIEEEWGIGF